MYHNISLHQEESLGLTLYIDKLEEQLQYINQNNYKTYFASEIEDETLLAKKSILITFDDVTKNQLLYASPLLIKYKIKATFFVPFSYVGQSDLWNEGSQELMTVTELKSLNSEIIELGHHSFFHKKYSTLSIRAIQEDIDKSYEFIFNNNLNVYSALAYPYGDFPKKGIHKQEFFSLLKKNNIKMAFRIGNRVNRFPFKNKFEIKRIDIKGEDNLFIFKLKLKLGKLRLF